MPERPPLLPVARPHLGPEEHAALLAPLTSGWVTQGPEVAAFEVAFAAAMGAPEAVAVSSCTAALHLVLLALGVGPGDEVVLPTHSFVATANVVAHVGARPVFVDVDDTLCLDPAAVAAALGPHTRAILAVHQVGMPCDLRAILAVAGTVPVVEDAACAVGSEVHWDGAWERIGRPRGVAACFSFHPRKLLTTGDGGMVTTRDPQLAAELRLLRHHGMDQSDTTRHAARTVTTESYVRVGWNYRMTDLQAAVGRVQLGRLEEILTRRRVQVATYRRLLAGSGVTPLREPAWARWNGQSFWVRLEEGVDRARLMQVLLDAGIATRPGVQDAHEEPAWVGRDWGCGADRATCGCAPGHCRRLARSEAARRQGLILPLFHDLTEADQVRVVDTLRAALG